MSEKLYLHCDMCEDERAKFNIQQSPADYAKLDVAISIEPDGTNVIHIECKRHNIEVDSFELKDKIFSEETCCECCGCNVDKPKLH